MKSGARERRRRRRVDVALAIKIEYNTEKIITRTKNISVLGTYLEIDKEIPIGTALDIKVKIPKTGHKKTVKEIDCAGVIFRSQPIASLGPTSQYGTGIFFRSFSGNGEKVLSKYIDYVIEEEKKKGKIYTRKRKKKQKHSKRKEVKK
ncbi:MAG: PilZ domain-containing protein [Candidatus Omnitrophota bacterium]|nr:MAG: PilZ domain-containing protein [Candidatus Omnitrophota bacterium]